MSDEKTVHFNMRDNKVERRFTEEWSKSGFINLNKLPELVQVIIDQKANMMLYIEALHDKIDSLIEHNHICNNPHCHTANCQSDHK